MNQLENRALINELVLKGQNVDSLDNCSSSYPYQRIRRESSALKQKKQIYEYHATLKQEQQKNNAMGINRINGSNGYSSYFGASPAKIISKSQYRQNGSNEHQKMEQTHEFTQCVVVPKQKEMERILKTRKIKNFTLNSQNLLIKKKCTCSQCQQCHKNLKNFTQYLKMFTDDQTLPLISAKSWCLWKKEKGRYVYIYGKRPYKQREIASLTKILVAIVVCDKLKKWNLLPSRIYYQIPKYVSDIKGTVANLKVGQIMSVTDLLYGMMLPSGNDAAVVLSELIGVMIWLQLRKKLKTFDAYSFESFKVYSSKSYSHYFITAMNQKCKELGLLNTFIHNPHGNDAFDHYKNVSNSHQISKMCFEILENQYLNSIINTKFYKDWINTNKLLWEGFQGIKTGITETAGPCLAALYKDILIVILNCKSMEQRWIQVKKLVKWVKTRR